MSLHLVVSRGRNYQDCSFFSYEIMEKATLDSGLDAVNKENKFVSSFPVPNYLEDKIELLVNEKLNSDVKIKWHDYDTGCYCLELSMFYPFRYSKNIRIKGLGSFILSMTLAAVHQDSLNNETPFKKSDDIYVKKVSNFLLPLLVRRGFKEDLTESPIGTYYCSIEKAFLESKKREEKKAANIIK